MSPAKNISELPKEVLGLTFINGPGDGKTTACVMTAACIVDRLRQGKSITKLTDTLECVGPTINRLCVRLNDSARLWDSDEQRTETMRPLILEILDTRGSRALEVRRAMRCADFAVRSLAPLAFEFIGRFDVAEQLRALEEVTDVASARRVRDATREIRDAAAAAAADAAYAYAAYAADAAAYAAYAAAAAAAAADAADAAAAAAAAADAADAAAAAKRSPAAGKADTANLAEKETPAAGSDVRACANERRRQLRDACVALIRELCAMEDVAEVAAA